MAAASLPSDSTSELDMSGFSNNQLMTASMLDSLSLPALGSKYIFSWKILRKYKLVTQCFECHFNRSP